MSILDEIEEKRRRLSAEVECNGLGAPEVIRVSQELDDLINQAYREGKIQIPRKSE